jgi:hypothetical protein
MPSMPAMAAFDAEYPRSVCIDSSVPALLSLLVLLAITFSRTPTKALIPHDCCHCHYYCYCCYCCWWWHAPSWIPEHLHRLGPSAGQPTVGYRLPERETGYQRWSTSKTSSSSRLSSGSRFPEESRTSIPSSSSCRPWVCSERTRGPLAASEYMMGSVDERGS